MLLPFYFGYSSLAFNSSNKNPLTSGSKCVKKA
nr:MAG TPA: hypothetical protein [Caudoviricetes sp.]